MSKLNELAELLKTAKRREEPVVECLDITEDVKPVVEPLRRVPEVVVDTTNSLVTKELALIKKALEQTNKRLSENATYSGGGVDSINQLRRPTKTIVSNYTPTYRDWYAGVGMRNEIITITLPIAENGQEFVIKDEAGIAENVPILVSGNIENDPTGLEMRLNYGSVTLLYNNGWRII